MKVVSKIIGIVFPYGNWWFHIPMFIFIMAHIVIRFTGPTVFGSAELHMLDAIIDPDMYWFKMAPAMFTKMEELLFVAFAWWLLSIASDIGGMIHKWRNKK